MIDGRSYERVPADKLGRYEEISLQRGDMVRRYEGNIPENVFMFFGITLHSGIYSPMAMVSCLLLS